MPVAYLTLPGIKASLHHERLELTIPPECEQSTPTQSWIPLLDLERVVVDRNAHISSRSISDLLERDIPVVFMRHGRFPGGAAQPFRPYASVLADQLDATREPDFRLANARLLVNAKIRNMRRVLQRLCSNRGSPAIASKWLGAIANQAKAAQSVDSLRGLEGAATGRYFENLNSFFPNDMPFGTRTRRPPLNEVNSLLSFGYTLLTAEFSMQIHATGLEPAWGVYHETEDGRPSLALDLIEPFRAPLVDALAIDLINHRRLKSEDFEKAENGGIYLKSDSRRTLYAAWEERIEREFNYEAENRRVTLRTLIADQARQLKRVFHERTTISPFIMN